MKTIRVLAPAKLNLTLDILGLRRDGYHELDMLMQAVSLCDSIEIAADTGGARALICEDPAGNPLPDIPADERNLAWRAADLFFQKTGIPDSGLSIRIVKRIPAQAGLAGGSADAAAVLRGLNALCGKPLRPKPLSELGADCGSDVPFCIRGGTARVRGRGERVRPVRLDPVQHYVIVKPSFGISTAALYAASDTHVPARRPDTDALLRCLRQGDAENAGAQLCNVFEPLAVQLHPEIGQIKEALLACGACGAQMTGSGSAVFGLFSGPDAAKRACESLKGGEHAVFYAHSV